jgi:hypothetical protein
MFFTDDFIASLRDDPVRGVLTLCEKALASINPD